MSNPHGWLMPYVERFADLHHLLGGGKPALALMQFGLWLLLYAILAAFVIRSRWVAGIVSYLLTGLMTLAATFYAITPAMNGIAVAYLTIIWPFWCWLGAGVPDWLAPHLFTFGPRP